MFHLLRTIYCAVILEPEHSLQQFVRRQWWRTQNSKFHRDITCISRVCSRGTCVESQWGQMYVLSPLAFHIRPPPTNWVDLLDEDAAPLPVFQLPQTAWVYPFVHQFTDHIAQCGSKAIWRPGPSRCRRLSASFFTPQRGVRLIYKSWSGRASAAQNPRDLVLFEAI